MPRALAKPRYPVGVWAICEDFQVGEPGPEGQPMERSEGHCADLAQVLKYLFLSTDPEGYSHPMWIRFFPDTPHGQDREAISRWMDCKTWASSRNQTRGQLVRALAFAAKVKLPCQYEGEFGHNFTTVTRKLWETMPTADHVIVDTEED